MPPLLRALREMGGDVRTNGPHPRNPVAPRHARRTGKAAGRGPALPVDHISQRTLTANVRGRPAPALDQYLRLARFSTLARRVTGWPDASRR